ncbi:c-type cytochrome [Nocardioides sp. SYSU D00038]|uniref:cytochrome bc1 complex diheme cytochrome c subunit n=1 Tax=Nocardioides sp. SYSU D00038 TaxID=2812554 RepID=UPI0019677A72|nr:c-type cytochrome [Nocardioides sp. SYSU D00038]
MRFLNRSVGRLSRHRRGPVAGLVLLLLGLLVSGGLYAGLAPASADETRTDAELIAEGRELFLVSCAFCHGQNGEGLETLNGNILGPSLVGVGAAAVDFQVGTGRMPMAQPGAQAPTKPEELDEDETEAVAAFVASLGPGPAVPSPEDYSLDGLDDEEREQAIVRGGQIFLTNCTACHNFNGKGGAMPRGGAAPDLSNTTPEHIYEAMLTGPGQMDSFSNGNLSPEEKRDVIAYLMNLREQPNYGGFTLGGLGPVSEGLFAWLGGIGALVAFAVWIAAHTTRSSKKKGETA